MRQSGKKENNSILIQEKYYNYNFVGPVQIIFIFKQNETFMEIKIGEIWSRRLETKFGTKIRHLEKIKYDQLNSFDRREIWFVAIGLILDSDSEIFIANFLGTVAIIA